MASGGDSDFLYSVGVDTTKAERDLQEFVNRGTAILSKMGDVKLNVNTAASEKNLSTFASAAEKASSRAKNASAGTTSSIEKDEMRLMATRVRIAGQAQAASDRYYATVASRAKQTADVEAKEAQRAAQMQTQAARQVEQAAAQQSKAQAAAAAAAQKAAAQQAAAQERIMRGGGGGGAFESGTRRQIGALGELNKILGNTVFKLIEYEVFMKAFNGVFEELKNSLTQASNTQFEQTLQHIYSPTINTTEALKNATIVARQWGSDINDVQQVIGLWTKQTTAATDAAGRHVTAQQALAGATLLANAAEEFHAASGIETLEVYRSSIALSSQLGVKLRDLPKYYDQIAEAATKIAVPLKAMGKSSEEGIKDIYEATNKDAALLKSLGFDQAQIIAINAAQVQALGEKGEAAGNQLSTMFAALATQGKGAGEFQKIIGKSNFDDPQKLIESFAKSGDALEKAFMQKLLSVKAQSGETFKSVIAQLKEVQVLSKDIENNSGGRLGQIAEASISNYQGQVAKLQTAVQAFSITLGKDLLPGMIQFVSVLATQVLPAMEHLIPNMLAGTHVALELGAAFLAFEAFNKITGFVKDMALAEEAATAAGFQNAAQMRIQTATIDALIARQNVLSEATAAATRMQIAYRAAMQEATAATAEFIGPLNLATGSVERLTTAEVGLVSTTRGIAGSMVAAASGIMGAAGAALSAAGPFIGLASSIGVAMAALGAFDDKKRRDAQIADAAEGTKTPGQRLGDLVRDPLGVMGRGMTAGIGQLTHPNDDAVADYANKYRGVNSNVGRDLQNVMQQRAALQAEQRKPGIHADLPGKIDALTSKAAQDIKSIGDYKDSQFVSPKAADYKALIAGLNRGGVGASLDHPMAEGVKPNPMYDPDLGKKKKGKKAKGDGSPSEQSAYKNAIADEKGNSAAELAAENDLLQVGRDQVEMQKQLAEAFGYTQATVKGLTLGYNEQIQATEQMRATAEKEAGALKKIVDSGEAKIKKHPKNKKADASETESIRIAENAYTKAAASVQKYTAQLQLLNAEKQKEVQLAQVHADLDNIMTRDRNVMNENAGLREHAVGADNKYLQDMRSGPALQKRYNQLNADINAEIAKGIDPKALEGASKLLGELKSAIDAAAQSAQQSYEKIQSLNKAVGDIAENSYKSNLGSLSYLVEGDGKDATADFTMLTNIAEAFKKIQDARDNLDKQQTEYGSSITAAQQGQLTAAREQLTLQSQLVPLVEQEKNYRESIKNSFDYQEESKINNMIGGDFIKSEQDNIFRLTRKGGQNNSGVKALSTYIGDMAQNWFKTLSQKGTDGKYGLNDHDKALDDMYKTYVKSLQDVVQSQIDKVVNPDIANVNTYQKAVADFGTYVTDFTDTIGKMPGSKAGSSGGATAGAAAATSAFGKLTSNGSEKMSGIGDFLTNDQGLRANDFRTNFDNTQIIADTNSSMATDIHSLLDTTSTASQAAVSPTGQSGAGGGSAGGGTTQDAKSLLAGTPFSALGSLFTNNPNSVLGGGDFSVLGKTTNLGSILNGATQGSGVGSVVGGLLNNGSNMSSLGGALGGGIGSIFGPIGSLVGSVGGGLLGGLFGSHSSPAKDPDIYDTQNYGQGVANLTGTAGANGQSFYQSPALYQTTGGLTGLQFIEETLAKYGSQSQAPQWLQPMFTQLVQDFGMSATGSGTLNFGKNIGDQYVSGATGATSDTKKYSDLDTLFQNFIQGYTQNQNTPLAPLISSMAFGAGPGYTGTSPYNTPGLNSSEFSALQTALTPFNGLGATTYGTPGVGTSTATSTSLDPKLKPLATAIGTAVSSALVNANITLNVDGQKMASVVSSYQTDAANRGLTTANAM